MEVLMNIHAFIHNDRFFMYNIDNCYITETNQAAYDVIQQICKNNGTDVIKELSTIYSTEKIEEVLQELKLVEKEMSLCQQDELRKVLPSDVKKTHPKQLILNVSQECNLGCEYCIVNKGEYGHKGKMSLDTAIRAIDFLLENSKGEEKFIVSFFGGEPLVNFPVIEKTAEYISEISHKKNISISMGITTNGTILSDRILECFKNNNIQVIISIDGPKEIHDRLRRFRNGKGTHDTIIDNIKRMLQSLPNGLTARATLTKHSPPFTEIGEYLENLGFKDVLFGRVLEFPTCNSTDSYTYEELAMTEQTIHNAAEAYYNISLQETLNTNRDSKYSFHKAMHMRQMQYIKEGHPRRFNCGACIKTLGVDINGDLYPCQYFVDMPDFKIGNIWDGRDFEKIANFYNDFESHRQKCIQCWAKNICGKGCFSKAVKDGCQFVEPDDNMCNIIRKHIEKSLYLYYENKSSKQVI